MLKAICDICGIRPADNHFKVKKEIETTFIDMGIVFPKRNGLMLIFVKSVIRNYFSNHQ
jgi:hypothetical protein